MNWDFSGFVEIGLALLSFAAAGFAYYVKTSAREQITKAKEEWTKQLGALKEKTDANERACADRFASVTMRIAVLEQQMRSLPQQRDFHRLNDHVAEMAGDMKKMSAEMHGLRDKVEAQITGILEGQARQETQMRVITDTLMERAKK